MTDQEQIEQMRIIILGDSTDTSKDDVFNIELQNALAIELNTLFPFDSSQTDIDKTNFRLRNWQVRCAIELYKGKSRAGVKSYSENGLSVSYMSTLISKDLLQELVPKVGVPKCSK